MSHGDNDNAKAQARSILGPRMENDILQSFVRIGMGDDEDSDTPVRAPLHQVIERKEAVDDRKDNAKPGSGDPKNGFKHKRRSFRSKKKKRVRREEEVCTDKDRAAAVVMGSKDIKFSLSLKNKQDRTAALQLPVETDPAALVALGRNELRAARHDTAKIFVDKALELCPDDKAALVARARCNLLLGEPKEALKDAEAALAIDPKYVKAVFEKAEALYHSGEFEHSLVFYHRGLRMRPDLQSFRLGIQKAQEAIENTIGASQPTEKKSKKKPHSNNSSSRTSKSRTTTASKPRIKTAKPVLGQLMVDKIYLENLLKHPDLNVADRKTNAITAQAEEALRFLDNRAEFWKQQQTS